MEIMIDTEIETENILIEIKIRIEKDVVVEVERRRDIEKGILREETIEMKEKGLGPLTEILEGGQGLDRMRKEPLEGIE